MSVSSNATGLRPGVCTSTTRPTAPYTKRCSTCKEEKPLDAFNKDRTQPSGLNYQCRACRADVNKRSYYRDRQITVTEQTCTACNKTKPADQFYKEARYKNGLMTRCKPCHTAQTIATRTREQVNAAALRWRRRNPDKVREANRRIKAMRRRNERRRWTPADWDALVSRFNGCCAYCGEKKDLTLDHVVPVSRGGRHAAGNFLPACLSCNSSKSDKFLVEWRRK